MRRSRCPGLATLLLVAACAARARAEEAAATAAVARPPLSLVLTAANFDKLVVPDERWLVYFGAPWCAHCRKLAPIWEQAATELEGQVRFGSVDATVETVLAKRFKVSAYPFVTYHVGSRWKAYGSEKTVVGFSEYAARMAAPPVRAYGSVKALRDALGPIGRAFVFAGRADEPLHAAFATVADGRFDELSFALLAEAPRGVRAQLGRLTHADAALAAGGDAALVGVLDGELFETFAPSAVALADAAALAASLGEWVAERERALVLAVTGANFHKLRRLRSHLALACVRPADVEVLRAQQRQMAAHALARGAHFQFGWIDASDAPAFWQSEYGLQQAALPTLLVLQGTGSAADAWHWRARNGSAPLGGVDEQADFLNSIVAHAVAPERSGEPSTVWAAMLRTHAALRSFASESPYVFGGCIVLNILFLLSMCVSLPALAAPPAQAAGARAKRE